MGSASRRSPLPFWWFFCLQLVKKCNEGARAMERTEQMYTLQKQLEFGKKKVRTCGSRVGGKKKIFWGRAVEETQTLGSVGMDTSRAKCA